MKEYVGKISNRLDHAYTEFPFDHESEQPESIVKCWLDQEFDSDNWGKKAIDFRIREFVTMVSLLDCFYYRAVNKNSAGNFEYFNPLQQDFTDFQNPDTVVYLSDKPYPTPDMVRHWCKTQSL